MSECNDVSGMVKTPKVNGQEQLSEDKIQVEARIQENVLGALLVPLLVPAKIISWATSDTNIPGHYPKSKRFLFDVRIVFFLSMYCIASFV